MARTPAVGGGNCGDRGSFTSPRSSKNITRTAIHNSLSREPAFGHTRSSPQPWAHQYARRSLRQLARSLKCNPMPTWWYHRQRRLKPRRSVAER